MKSLVKVTSRGRITLPGKLRKEAGLGCGGVLIVEKKPEGLLLRPAVTLPVELYAPEREREFDEAEADLDRVL
jgi:antitoxin PrlF